MPKMSRHHSWIVIGGLGGQFHPSLGEKVPYSLQVAVGRRDAQKLALVNTEQGQDFNEVGAVRTAKTIRCTCFPKSTGQPEPGCLGSCHGVTDGC